MVIAGETVAETVVPPADTSRYLINNFKKERPGFILGAFFYAVYTMMIVVGLTSPVSQRLMCIIKGNNMRIMRLCVGRRGVSPTIHLASRLWKSHSVSFEAGMPALGLSPFLRWQDQEPVLQCEVAVGHARDVVADAAFEAIAANAGRCPAAELIGIPDKEMIKLGNHAGSLAVGIGHFWVPVKFIKEVFAEGGELIAGFSAECCEAAGMMAHVVDRSGSAELYVQGALTDEIIHEVVYEAANDESPVDAGIESVKFPACQSFCPNPERNIFEPDEIEKSGVQAIVEIMARVGDFV